MRWVGIVAMVFGIAALICGIVVMVAPNPGFFSVGLAILFLGFGVFLAFRFLPMVLPLPGHRNSGAGTDSVQHDPRLATGAGSASQA